MPKKTHNLVIVLLLLGLICPKMSWGAEKPKQADKKSRQKVHYVLSIDLKDGIEKVLSKPIEILREKLLTNIEQENGIRIERSSMVRTDKCLADLLASVPHLAKISVGNRIIQAKIELNAQTSQKSVWTKWEMRKLEHPELKITFFYENTAVEPSEISCSGYKYH